MYIHIHIYMYIHLFMHIPMFTVSKKVIVDVLAARVPAKHAGNGRDCLHCHLCPCHPAQFGAGAAQGQSGGSLAPWYPMVHHDVDTEERLIWEVFSLQIRYFEIGKTMISSESFQSPSILLVHESSSFFQDDFVFGAWS